MSWKNYVKGINLLEEIRKENLRLYREDNRCQKW